MSMYNSNLYSKVALLLDQARKHIVTQVNTTMIETYRHIGREIVEFEQGGKERAEYGEEIVRKLYELE